MAPKKRTALPTPQTGDAPKDHCSSAPSPLLSAQLAPSVPTDRLRCRKLCLAVSATPSQARPRASTILTPLSARNSTHSVTTRQKELSKTKMHHGPGSDITDDASLREGGKWLHLSGLINADRRTITVRTFGIHHAKAHSDRHARASQMKHKHFTKRQRARGQKAASRGRGRKACRGSSPREHGRRLTARPRRRPAPQPLRSRPPAPSPARAAEARPPRPATAPPLRGWARRLRAERESTHVPAAPGPGAPGRVGKGSAARLLCVPAPPPRRPPRRPARSAVSRPGRPPPRSPRPCASPGRKQGRRTWKTPSRRFMAAAARQ